MEDSNPQGFLGSRHLHQYLGFLGYVRAAGELEWQGSPSRYNLSERTDEKYILLHKSTNKETGLSLPWLLEDEKSLPKICDHSPVPMQVWGLNSQDL